MIVIDVTSPVPASEQVRVQIAGAIRANTLRPGERIASVRQLAADIDLAPRTVAKAYAALEADGLVTTSRSRGTRVAVNMALEADAQAAIRTLLAGLDRRRVDLDALLSVIRAEWDNPSSA